MYRDVVCQHVTELPVLGVPVRFETNAPEALAVIEKAYGAWRAIAGRPELLATTSARVRVIVHPGDEGGDGYPGIRSRMPDNERLMLHTAGSLALADASRLEAVAYVTPALVATEHHFQRGVLDALTLLLVTRVDRQPVHAAGVARDDVALLLAGPSGVGKSTVAYAAARAGYRLLSDDVVYVQLSPSLRVWGLGRSIVLLPEAREHFPEAHGYPEVRRLDGVRKIIVEAGNGWSSGAAPFAERAGICLLERDERCSLERLTPAAMVEHLVSRLDPGFDRFAPTIADAIQRVADRGAWRLRLSGSPQTCIPYIHRMVTELA